MIKLSGLIKEAALIPPTLYHATYKPLMRKIEREGLDPSKGKKSWEGSKPGVVYLAVDPDAAISYAEASDLVPDSYIDSVVLLHINTASLDRSKLAKDGNVLDSEGDTLEYEGVIPWSAITKVVDVSNS